MRFGYQTLLKSPSLTLLAGSSPGNNSLKRRRWPLAFYLLHQGMVGLLSSETND